MNRATSKASHVNVRLAWSDSSLQRSPASPEPWIGASGDDKVDRDNDAAANTSEHAPEQSDNGLSQPQSEDNEDAAGDDDDRETSQESNETPDSDFELTTESESSDEDFTPGPKKGTPSRKAKKTPGRAAARTRRQRNITSLRRGPAIQSQTPSSSSDEYQGSPTTSRTIRRNIPRRAALSLAALHYHESDDQSQDELDEAAEEGPENSPNENSVIDSASPDDESVSDLDLPTSPDTQMTTPNPDDDGVLRSVRAQRRSHPDAGGVTTEDETDAPGETDEDYGVGIDVKLKRKRSPPQEPDEDDEDDDVRPAGGKRHKRSPQVHFSDAIEYLKYE